MVMLLRPYWVGPAMVSAGNDMERVLASQQATINAIQEVRDGIAQLSMVLRIGLDVEEG